MVRQTVEKVYSDLSGEELEASTTSLTFAFDGTQYEIDVTLAEREDFASTLSKFIEAGRPVSARSDSRRAATRSAGPSPKDVRAWAAENDLEVPARGRIPARILEAYAAAH